MATEVKLRQWHSKEPLATVRSLLYMFLKHSKQTWKMANRRKHAPRNQRHWSVRVRAFAVLMGDAVGLSWTQMIGLWGHLLRGSQVIRSPVASARCLRPDSWMGSNV